MIDNKLIDNIYYDVNNIKVKDEFDLDDIKSKIINRTILKGLYAGAGKTTASIHYNKNALFICPTNKLCQGLKEKGVEAITFSKLFGLFGDDKKLKNMKSFDIGEYDCICFDEVYLYTPNRLRRIYKFINDNPDKIVIATGDVSQRNPIGFDNSNYIDSCISFIFNNCITLQINKRLDNDNDRKKLKGLKKDIFNLEMNIVDIYKKYGFNLIYDMKDVDSRKNIVYFKFRGDIVNHHVRKLEKKGELNVGDIVLGRCHYKKGGNVIHSNYEYVIVRIDDDGYLLKDVVEDTLNLLPIGKEDVIKLPYALTLDSIQGLDFDEKVTIFDSNLPYVDRRFIYTAITRVRKLSDISIYVHSEKEVKSLTSSKIKQYFEWKIQGYEDQDRRRYRSLDSYITLNWISNKISETKLYCEECGERMKIGICDGKVVSDVTVDRLDNSLGHSVDNCRLCCLHCNVSLK
jgi:hypothetical protein